MCGIAGAQFLNDVSHEFLTHTVERMTRKLFHRGPDGEGFYFHHHTGLGMRRLSVIDLETGNQPMISADGRYSLVFNGEIYNYRELRQTHLAGHAFKSKSDTEVLLALFQRYGEKCLSFLNGMFAFAVYDREEKSLFIARDRIGIKPLFYYADEKRFLFSSEAKSFFSLEWLPLSIDHSLYPDYFSLGVIPEPWSIFKEVKKLPAGCFLRLSREQMRIESYWDLASEAQPTTLSALEAAESLRELVASSVRYRLVSDVKVGSFLSGGVDSSIITHEMRRALPQVETFTIDFSGASNHGDLMASRSLARQWHLLHHETILEPDVLKDVDSFLLQQDEPFAITSALPLYVNSKLARQHVKVVLSGDGADEVFGGYARYRLYKKMQILRQWGVSPSQRVSETAASFFNSLGSEKWRKGYYYLLRPILNSLAAPKGANEYLAFLDGFGPGPRESFFNPEVARAFRSPVWYESRWRDSLGTGQSRMDMNQVLGFDLQTSLVDEMLTKVDRASMLCGLEVRVPFLDHRVVSFAMGLPASWKLRGQGKWLLKLAYDRALPASILHAKKRGFNLPLDRWIRSLWRESFAEAFQDSAVHELGILPKALKVSFAEYLENPKALGGMKYYYFFCLIRWYQGFQNARVTAGQK